jgi:predicted XRE-type DNA-binding protein
MSTIPSNLSKIMDQPSYWVEAFNGELYDAIAKYMDENNINRKQLSEKLGISKGRVSQILNGNINFSIEKFVEISLKIDKYPCMALKSKSDYRDFIENDNSITFEFTNEYSSFVEKLKPLQNNECKFLHLNQNISFELKDTIKNEY